MSASSARHRFGLAALVAGLVVGGCGPQPAPTLRRRVAPPPRRAETVSPYVAALRQARAHLTARRYAAAFGEMAPCVDGPKAERPPARLRCLVLAMRNVDRALEYYRLREHFLHDLVGYGRNPPHSSPGLGSRAWLLKRAEKRARSIGEQRLYRQLVRLKGSLLAHRAQQLVNETRAEARGLGLVQREDPDRGPIRTFRYAHRIRTLYPRSSYVAEADFLVVRERRELRLAAGGKVFPWYGLQEIRDLEGLLKKHPRARFTVRVRWELANFCYELWLLSNQVKSRTIYYRDYLRVGGKPLTAPRVERYRQRAIRLFDGVFKRLPELRVTYYADDEEYRRSLRQGRQRRIQLKRPKPPKGLQPMGLFPPG